MKEINAFVFCGPMYVNTEMIRQCMWKERRSERWPTISYVALRHVWPSRRRAKSFSGEAWPGLSEAWSAATWRVAQGARPGSGFGAPGTAANSSEAIPGSQILARAGLSMRSAICSRPFQSKARGHLCG